MCSAKSRKGDGGGGQNGRRRHISTVPLQPSTSTGSPTRASPPAAPTSASTCAAWASPGPSSPSRGAIQ